MKKSFHNIEEKKNNFIKYRKSWAERASYAVLNVISDEDIREIIEEEIPKKIIIELQIDPKNLLEAPQWIKDRNANLERCKKL